MKSGPSSIDFARLERQSGDGRPVPFSFLTDSIDQPQLDCHITYTCPEVHAIIRENLHRAPMYSGQIASVGPPRADGALDRNADIRGQRNVHF